MKSKLSLFLLLAAFILISCGGKQALNHEGQEDAAPPPAPLQLKTFYLDSDGDGFGDPDKTVQAENAPAGYVADNTDCNDKDKKVNPASLVFEDKDASDDANCDGIFSWVAGKSETQRSNPQESTLTLTSWDPASRILKSETHKPNDPRAPVVSNSEITYDEKGNTLSRKFFQNGVLSGSEEGTYDSQGRVLTKKVFENGKTRSTENFYDAQGHLETSKTHDGDLNGPVLRSGKYTYDAQGNRLTSESHEGDLDAAVARTDEYRYDDQGNLLVHVVHESDLNSRITLTHEYTYDAQGNRLTFINRNTLRPGREGINSEAYTYDSEGNQLTLEQHARGNLETPVTRFDEKTYDGQGNMLTYRIHGRGGLETPVTYSYERTYNAQGSLFASRNYRGDLGENEAESTGRTDFIPIHQPLIRN